jgi:hypothetical protein
MTLPPYTRTKEGKAPPGSWPATLLTGILLPSADLRPFVEQLAFRIATFSADALRSAKQAIDAAGQPLYDGLREEAYLRSRGKAACPCRASLSSPPSVADMEVALRHLATGSQPVGHAGVACKNVVLRQHQQEVTDDDWRNS